MWAESATAQQRAMAAAGGGGDLAMALAWVWSAEVEDDAKELDQTTSLLWKIYYSSINNHSTPAISS